MPNKKGLLSIEITGLRDVQGRFARVSRELLDGRREELRQLGRRVVSALQAEAPVRTGRLKKGLRYHTTKDGREMELRVTSEAPYTDLVIRGRGPVFARRAKALRFEPGPPGSGFIFRRSVGPAKANPFQARAFRSLMSQGEPETTARRIGQRINRAWSGI